MSSKRFIEFYSANRNRESYPQQAKFDILFGAPKVLYSPLNAEDPVTKGVIYYNWSGFVGNLYTNILKAGSSDGLPLLGDDQINPQLSSIPNFYTGYDLSISAGGGVFLEKRQIITYTPSNASVIPLNAYSGVSTGDVYEILDSTNNAKSLIHIPSVDGSGRSILSFSQAYKGYYIVDETLTQSSGGIVYRQITNYDYVTQMATINEPFPAGFSNGNFFTLRKNLPNTQLNIVSTTSSTITFDANASAVDNSYVNSYIYITTIIGPVPSGFIAKTNYTNQSFYVTAYNGATRKATVKNTSQIYLPNGVLPQNLIANIVSFSNDNSVPLLYNGNLVSQNESVCYEVSLINLSLPNVVLKTGGRIAFYPFVYVELSNISSPSCSSKNIIYSNNPDSTNALFIAPVTDISQPVNSTFLKIDGGTMTQTIKFKPNDSLRFSVFLPDGTLFETNESDNLSPYPPNFLLQIDALFSIKRL